MFKKNKNILILIFGIILFIFFCFLFIRPFIFNNSNTFSINKEIKVKECIKDRFTKSNENIMLIGKNEKEVENGYFDIKIEYLADSLLVYFNKIYKEEKVESIYVNEKYLLEVIKYINDVFLLNIDERNMYELVILIKDKYMAYRVDNKEKFIDIYKFNTNYNFSFYILDDMPVLKIKND